MLPRHADSLPFFTLSSAPSARYAIDATIDADAVSLLNGDTRQFAVQRQAYGLFSVPSCSFSAQGLLALVVVAWVCSRPACGAHLDLACALIAECPLSQMRCAREPHDCRRSAQCSVCVCSLLHSGIDPAACVGCIAARWRLGRVGVGFRCHPGRAGKTHERIACAMQLSCRFGVRRCSVGLCVCRSASMPELVACF